MKVCNVCKETMQLLRESKSYAIEQLAALKWTIDPVNWYRQQKRQLMSHRSFHHVSTTPSLAVHRI
jgi:hypothetical protein